MDTKEFMFAGYSDDTFGEDSDRGDDYDNCACGKPIRWELKTREGEGIVIFGQYCPDGAGGWVVGVGRLDSYDDDRPMPLWPMRYEHSKRASSPRLVVTAPADAVLTCLERSADED